MHSARLVMALATDHYNRDLMDNDGAAASATHHKGKLYLAESLRRPPTLGLGMFSEDQSLSSIAGGTCLLTAKISEEATPHRSQTTLILTLLSISKLCLGGR